MKRFTLLALLLALVSITVADDTDPLPANRPNFSSNAEVVPQGMCILETGTTYLRNGSSKTWSGIEGELRLGFAAEWEADFLMPNYTSGSIPRGWGDAGFQFVRQLPSFQGWHAVVAAGATIPSGQVDLTAGAFNPMSYLSVDHDLGHDLQLTNTFSTSWTNVGGAFLPAYANALMVSKDFGRGLGGFVELYSGFAPRQTTTQTLNVGYTFAHNSRQQVDIHVGRSIAGAPSDNWFVGGGYSQRLGRSHVQ